MRALVVFTNGSEDRHPLDPLLKRGFKHVFVCVLAGDYWLRIDGARGVPVIDVMAGPDFDLATFWRAQGHTVVEAQQLGHARPAPLVWRNCVGLVKSFLCLRTWALTPWQLYKAITR